MKLLAGDEELAVSYLTYLSDPDTVLRIEPQDTYFLKDSGSYYTERFNPYRGKKKEEEEIRGTVRVRTPIEFSKTTRLVMESLPNEQLEAARLETDSTFRILLSVIIPQLRHGIVCTWVLSFTEHWNSVAEPLILLETHDRYPLAVMLNEIEAGDVLGLAAAVVFMLPPLLLFEYFENEIMEGLEDYKLK